MSKLYPHVFAPGKIGNLTLKNRIVKAPQSSGMNNKDGSVSERAIRYYRDVAAGGAGMIIVEYAYVDDIGAKSAHCHLGISSDEDIPGLTWLAENIKEEGSVPAIQIEHCGRQKFLGTQPICSASAIPWPMLWNKVGVQSVPHVLTIPEIQDIVHAFGDAALRAKMAGFELVEIHGAHGYLLTNFFSPTTNHRTDLYGGSLENRMRIYLEVYRDVRAKVGPDFPVTIRLSGTDYEPDGFPVEDTIALAKALEAEGIDGIHISGGDHHTMIHQVTPMSIPVCHNAWAAERVKKEVSIPVIASGSITLPEYAEDIIASGKGDFVGLGRPLWADPEWPKKAEADHPEDIRPCIRCNEGCLERTFFQFKAVTCAVNPQISREGELKPVPTQNPKKVAVIGAGPAGLSAAIYALRAGKSALVLDEKGYGGQIVNTPEVENYPGIKQVSGIEFAANLYEQAKSLGAEVKTERVTGVADADSSVKIVNTGSGFYECKAVIIATGAKNRVLGFDGEVRLTGSGVSYCATCDGNFFRGRDVAVIGGGNTALEDAEVLSGIANKVYLVHRRDAFRGDQSTVNRLRAKENLEMVLDSVPVKVVGDMMVAGLEVSNVKTGESRVLDVQGIFVAAGQVPDNKDFENVAELDPAGYVAASEDCLTKTPGVFTAGDCRTKKVRQLTTAAADGAVAALAASEYINQLG